MKYFALFLFVFLCFSTHAQNDWLLTEKRLISDLSHTPIYPRIIEVVNGETEWKPTFRYLDSVDMYNITYLSDNLKVKGLMVKPRKVGNYPCIIFNRGGNRDFGALKIAHAVYIMGRIAKEGYVVIASQYRGNGGGEGLEEFGGSEVNDITILTEVLTEIEEADTDRIGMYGWSRGGMMTFLALKEMDNIKAAVVGGAVTNHFEMIADRPEMDTFVLAELVPDYENVKEEALTKRSAIKWVDELPKNVPILMLHGNADWRVKPEQSLQMALAFEQHRIPYRLIMFEGGDHGISEHRDEVNQQVINWFNRFVKNGEALPDMKYHGK